MKADKPFTKDQAVRLSRSLVAQLKRRSAAMQLEVKYGRGVSITDKVFVKPKPWVLRAARIATEEISKLMGDDTRQDQVTAQQAGVFIGIAKTFAAVMEGTSAEVTELESRYPDLIDFRKEIAALAKPEIEHANNLDQHLARTVLPASDEVLYGKGRHEGSQVIIDGSGNLQHDQTLRAEVCWFLWVYWPEVKFIKSMPELLKFLVEDFQMRTLTLANLTNICGEIELRFKGRGRPAK